MKKAVFPLLLVFILFTGMVIAPVVPTRGLYVNDYATVLFREDKSFMLEQSRLLAEQTDLHAVVLTVSSLDGLSAEEYCKQVYAGWYNRGDLEEDAVFILFSSHDKSLTVWPFGKTTGAFPGTALESMQQEGASLLEKFSPSRATLDLYKSLLLRLYPFSGIEPGEALALEAEPERGKINFKSSFYSTLSVALGALILVRCIYIGRKYRAKYGGGSFAPRKSFRAQPRPVFDDTEERIDIIELDEEGRPQQMEDKP